MFSSKICSYIHVSILLKLLPSNELLILVIHVFSSHFCSSSLDNGCAQVLVGALYPSHVVISMGHIGRFLDGGFQVMGKK